MEHHHTDVGVLQDIVAGKAREASAMLPPRYSARPHAKRAAMVITDTDTGLTATVPLVSYRAVCEALASLYGREPLLPATVGTTGISYGEWHRRLAAGEVINGLHVCPEYVGVHRADHANPEGY